MTEGWIENFNLWRERYDSMSFQAQEAFYESAILSKEVGEAVKNQLYFNRGVITVCFEAIFLQKTPVNVLEMGGWRGEMAELILSKFPFKIFRWQNYEICEWARTNPVCERIQYYAPPMLSFLWEEEYIPGFFDVLILSHVIEHIKLKHLLLLLNKVKKDISFLYIDAPIEERTESVNWKDYNGTHILEIGWNDLDPIIKDLGFEKLCDCTNQIKFYKGESKIEKVA